MRGFRPKQLRTMFAPVSFRFVALRCVALVDHGLCTVPVNICDGDGSFPKLDGSFSFLSLPCPFPPENCQLTLFLFRTNANAPPHHTTRLLCVRVCSIHTRQAIVRTRARKGVDAGGAGEAAVAAPLPAVPASGGGAHAAGPAEVAGEPKADAAGQAEADPSAGGFLFRCAGVIMLTALCFCCSSDQRLRTAKLYCISLCP